MRKAITIFLILSMPALGSAQSTTIDSLRRLLSTEKEDTSRVLLLNQSSNAYSAYTPDTALLLSQQALLLAKKAGFRIGEARSLIMMAGAFIYKGNYPKALELHLEALKLAEDISDKSNIASSYTSIALDYSDQGNYRTEVNYLMKGLAIDENINFQRGILVNLLDLGDAYEKLDMLDSANIYTSRAYTIAVQQHDADLTGIALNNLGNIYSKKMMDTVAMSRYRMGIPYLIQEKDDDGLCEVYLGMAKLFQRAGSPDSSVRYAKLSLTIGQTAGFIDRVMNASNFLTSYYVARHNTDSAFAYQSASIAARDSLFSQQKANQIQNMTYDESIRQQQIEEAKEQARAKLKQGLMIGGLGALVIVALILYRNNRQKREANMLLQKQKEEIDGKAHELSVQKENLEQLGEIGRKITSSLSVEKIIGTVYDNVNTLMDASVFGIGIYHEAQKIIEFPATYEDGEALPFYTNSIDDKNRFAVICFKEGREIIIGDLEKEHKLYIQEVQAPHEGKQPLSLIYLPLVVKDTILGVITVQSFQRDAYSEYDLFMLRNIAIYTAIALENAESYETLSQTVVTLKATQSQLIQSEKMASLGELTAGIAHEIQNPLNFVNNFSEVNKELLVEMNDEIEKGNYNEVKSIAKDLTENEEKITHHGKRADAIVKGMLQHSRISTGAKEPTDINALADEYLRLSYHGLRAKDKEFNAEMKTDFDTSIGKTNIIPQDIGRVLLNLYNNAFYAVNEKKKQQVEEFEPTVSVSSKKMGDKVVLTVKDNGNGIPQKVIDKIFQPFFTTKPTGEGTGLGLSLSYDIIKAHGGEIKVNTIEGEFTELVIQLPILA